MGFLGSDEGDVDGESNHPLLPPTLPVHPPRGATSAAGDEFSPLHADTEIK